MGSQDGGWEMGRKGVIGRDRSRTQSFGQSTGPGTDLRHFEKWGDQTSTRRSGIAKQSKY